MLNFQIPLFWWSNFRHPIFNLLLVRKTAPFYQTWPVLSLHIFQKLPFNLAGISFAVQLYFNLKYGYVFLQEWKVFSETSSSPYLFPLNFTFDVFSLKSQAIIGAFAPDSTCDFDKFWSMYSPPGSLKLFWQNFLKFTHSFRFYNSSHPTRFKHWDLLFFSSWVVVYFQCCVTKKLIWPSGVRCDIVWNDNTRVVRSQWSYEMLS